MENLGALAILIAFCLSVYAVLASLAGAWKRKPFLVRSGERAVLGELSYSWQVVAMKKVKFHSLDAIGYHPLDLPRLTLETTGFWL